MMQLYSDAASERGDVPGAERAFVLLLWWIRLSHSSTIRGRGLCCGSHREDVDEMK